MPIMFNTLLLQYEIDPREVRLLRHVDKRADKGLTPYDLWRLGDTKWLDTLSRFEAYQSTQRTENHKLLDAPYWASFVGTPAGDTQFAALYRVEYKGLLAEDRPHPIKYSGIEKAGRSDEYNLTVDERFREYVGKLFIDWGEGFKAFIQRADRQNKRVIELREDFKEPAFPGLLEFVAPLNELDALPAGWKVRLTERRGIYLLTCPTTGKPYVGSATGEDTFWGRWQEYVRTGHGGNKKIKEHIEAHGKMSFVVSILEVAGTAATERDIRNMEQRWMDKLQSKEFGLNC